MRIFGFNITREKAAKPVTDWHRGWRVIHEPYTGAWQKNDELKRGDLTCYPALYACLNRITQDIGKLPFLLKKRGANGIWEVAETRHGRPSCASRMATRPRSSSARCGFCRNCWTATRLS